LALSGIQARAATTAWTGTGDWTANPGNWSNGLPANGDHVVITSGSVLLTNSSRFLASFTMNGGTLTFTNWNTMLYATNVTVNNGAKLTHGLNTANTTNGAGQWIPNSRVYVSCSNITINAGGSINADYVGYKAGKGPGADPVGSAGTAHSGPGRRSAGGAAPKPAYNDPAGPEQPGSGGNAAYIANSSAGGGAIKVVASGQITLYGTVTANGKNPVNTHGGGGSGGSIWLSCRTFAGSTNGLISVNGGNGNYYGGAACAGRIALLYDTNDQAGLPEPCPRVRFSGLPGQKDVQPAYERLPPAMGTLRLPDTRLLSEPFTARRFYNVRLMIPGFTNWTKASLTLNDCILGLPDGITVNVPGNMVLTNGATLHLFAKPVADPLIQDGASLTVGGHLFVCANSWILPYADPTNGATVGISVGSNLVVATGGGIDADDKGYNEAMGPGIAGGAASVTGAGYGGEGGWGFYGSTGYGHTYGTPEGRAQAGSGGGNAYVKAGKGGGAVRIVAGGDVTVNGLITARGSHGLYAHGAGGSGGGISITCRTLQGANTGLLRADAGQGNYYGACGGGGRIALRYNQALQAALPAIPQLRFSTFAHTNTSTTLTCEWAFWGRMGTLYLPDTSLLATSSTASTVLNAFRFWHTELVISNHLGSWSPAALVISNCVVRFPRGYRLNIAGNLDIAGGGTLPSDLSGRKEGRLVVQAGTTNKLYGARIDVGGSLTIRTNGWLYPLTAETNGPAGKTNAVVGIRVARNVTIHGGGGIYADGGGYKPVAGNGNGYGAGRNNGSGGGYGGLGGGTAGGYTYDTAGVPIQPGSPGGVFTVYNSGKGGGAVHVIAGGYLTVNGTVSANGMPGAYYGGTGASGGSVFLTCMQFSGAGILKANGGPKGSQSAIGDGGGGRIAVWHRIDTRMADYRLSQKNVTGMTYTTNLATFTGQLFVNAGGTNSQAGTKGFYEGQQSGAFFLLL